MHILVTNDDGITAPGLLALAQGLRSLGQVTVLAPDHNWSASGHVKTLHRPLRVKEIRLADDSVGYASDGAPSDCVALAMLGLFPERVDLVVSGINPNINIGHDVTYSGTVTAAMEAAISGVPGLAFSINSPENQTDSLDYGPAARIAFKITQMVIENHFSPASLLNVNIPYLKDDEIKGIKLTRQGLRIYRDQLVRRLDPRNRPYYWIGGDSPTGVAEDGTDYGAVAEGYVSITPLQLDLTDYHTLTKLNTITWKL
jgi:5'-nucleotidase